MSESMQLVEAIVGMGNPVHSHVRRHNEITAHSGLLDKMVNEQLTGGIVPSTLSEFSILSGGLTTAPQGDILLSDGWNSKRGLCVLRFVVSTNAVQQEELAVLGYLTGGDYSAEGIDGNTTFVPVRSWSVLMSNRQDLDSGLPYTQSSIVDSQQFLLGTEQKLSTNRPIDIINNIGILATREDSGITIEGYSGMTSQDMKVNGIVMSKTQNLDPTHCASAILGTTIRAMAESIDNGNNKDMFTQGVFEGASSSTMIESNPMQNAFFLVMNSNLGGMSLTGFNGYTMEEINSVFVNLPDVLNLNMLGTTFADPNWLGTSFEYGSSGYGERIACEIAALTVHALTRSGLTSVEFLASNNTTEIGGLNSENGLMYHMGSAMPMLQNETNLPGRVEAFKEYLSRSFFSRYRSDIRGGFSVSIRAACYVFGETSVTVVINGKPESERTYANATYLINLTSTNISENDKAVLSSVNMIKNIEEYLGF